MIGSLDILFSILLVIVYCPLTEGHLHIYNMVIDPLLTKYENTIGRALENARAELDEKLRRVKKTIIEKAVE